jgi:Cu+-exporting ATPase
MKVSEESPHRYDHAGRQYRFCGAGCLAKFRADPDRYLNKPAQPVAQMTHHAAAPATPTAPIAPTGLIDEYTCPMHPEVRQSGPGSCPKCGMALEPSEATALLHKTEWVCPMHPQIVRDGPGACPICGMALEPRTVTLEEPPNPELIEMTRRFWVGVALCVPLLTLVMDGMLPGRPITRTLGPTPARWLELTLATPVVLWGGWPFFVRGWQSIVHRSANMFTLIALGVSVAYIESVLATVAPQLFPAAFREHGR